MSSAGLTVSFAEDSPTLVVSVISCSTVSCDVTSVAEPVGRGKRAGNLAEGVAFRVGQGMPQRLSWTSRFAVRVVPVRFPPSSVRAATGSAPLSGAGSPDKGSISTGLKGGGSGSPSVAPIRGLCGGESARFVEMRGLLRIGLPRLAHARRQGRAIESVGRDRRVSRQRCLCKSRYRRCHIRRGCRWLLTRRGGYRLRPQLRPGLADAGAADTEATIGGAVRRLRPADRPDRRRSHRHLVRSASRHAAPAEGFAPRHDLAEHVLRIDGARVLTGAEQIRRSACR